jgi:roadblock/LC7 domain-containing protein
MTNMTKKDMEAEIARLQAELKNAKNAPSNNKTYSPLTKKLADGMSQIVFSVSKAGNYNITSFTTPEFTSWIKSNGYAFPSGKYFNKGIKKEHWTKAVKDMEKHGIAVLTMTPYGKTTGI